MMLAAKVLSDSKKCVITNLQSCMSIKNISSSSVRKLKVGEGSSSFPRTWFSYAGITDLGDGMATLLVRRQ